MKRMRESPEILVLKFTWPALLFAAVWLWFPATREHLDARIEWVYGVLALMGLVTLLRLRVALRRPGAKVLKYIPVFDAAALAVLIRLTGGVRSDMWLFTI